MVAPEPRQAGVSLTVAAAVAAASGVLTTVILLVLRRQGIWMPVASWMSAALVVAVAAAVTIAVWPVRRHVRSGAAVTVHALRAARVLALAQASLITGALLVGWYVGQVLVYVPDADVESVRRKMLVLGLNAAAGAILALVGWWGQRCCRVTPRSLDDASEE